VGNGQGDFLRVASSSLSSLLFHTHRRNSAHSAWQLSSALSTRVTQVEDKAALDTPPVGVKAVKVKAPVGYLGEKEAPAKYTTKEGYAVAGPHVSGVDEEEEEAVAESGKYRKMKFGAGATGELPSPRTAK
jgi:hypothetical protein